jgi:hypothetical protein
MPDDPNVGTPAPPAPANPAERTFTQQELERIIGERLSRQAAQYGLSPEEAQQLRTRVQTLESQGQTELQRIERERDDARQRLADLEPENLRLQVSVQKGLTGDLAWVAERLRGSTLEEMAADADTMLQRIVPSAPAAPAPSADPGIPATAPAPAPSAAPAARSDPSGFPRRPLRLPHRSTAGPDSRSLRTTMLPPRRTCRPTSRTSFPGGSRSRRSFPNRSRTLLTGVSGTFRPTPV